MSALVGAGLLWLAVGPVVALVAALALVLAPVRRWLRPTRGVALGWVAALAVLTGIAVAVPDGWVPIPPGPGAWVTPGYVGRPARAEAVAATPQNPHLAAGALAGPLGESPHVSTRSYGVDGCRDLVVDSHRRLLTLCGSADEPVLRLVDPGSLGQLASKALPTRDGSPCAGAFFLDAADRVVVATHDRRLLVVRTADGDGDADLTTQASTSIAAALPDGDCVAGLAPDWRGRTWLVSRSGRVGVLDGARLRVLDLGVRVTEPPAGARDGVYVATAESVLRLDARPAGRPVVTWRAGADHPGTPAPNGRLVAVTDGDELLVLRADDGAETCRADASRGAVVAAGAGFVVAGQQGYAGPLSAVLGRAPGAGLARVDAVRGACQVTWTSDLSAPSGTPAVGAATGLLYAYTKRHSWLGVDAWYLTALDLRTGRAVWSVRTGLGVLRDNHHGSVTLGPDGSAYVPVLGGLVRVHDRTGLRGSAPR
jgi:hypothetical protein